MNHECHVVDEVYEIYQSQIPFQPINERERLSSSGVRKISADDDDRLHEIFVKCSANTDCENCVIWRLYSGSLSEADISEEGAVISGSEHKYEIRRERLGAFYLTDESRNVATKVRVEFVRI